MNTGYPTLNFGLGEDIDMLRDQVYQFAQNEIAPLHQPHNLAGVQAALAAFPLARQVAQISAGISWKARTFSYSSHLSLSV